MQQAVMGESYTATTTRHTEYVLRWEEVCNFRLRKPPLVNLSQHGPTACLICLMSGLHVTRLPCMVLDSQVSPTKISV